MTEVDAMDCLMDGGFLTDVCLDKTGEEILCQGVLKVNYHSRDAQEGRDAQENRNLRCAGTTAKSRHQMHFLAGSVFEGRRKLSAVDVVGVLQCFGAAKNIETASLDTGIHRTVIGLLFDRLRVAAAMVAEFQREAVIFESCEVHVLLQLPSQLSLLPLLLLLLGWRLAP